MAAKPLDRHRGVRYHPPVTHRLTIKVRKHIGQISGGSRLLAELAVDAISLRQLNSDVQEPCLYHSTQEFILRHGWLFSPQPFPAKYRKWKGEHHDCLYNALELSVSCRELAYVEGFAMPAKGITETPVAHSWCVDADGKVVDPTWDRPGREYCGLSLDKRLLYKLHQKGEPFGLMFNDELFWEVTTGKRDWRELLATGSVGFRPERELPS